MITKNIIYLGTLFFSVFAGSAEAGEESGAKWVAQVAGMSCPLCAKNIEKQVAKLEGVTDVKIDLGTGAVTIFYSSGKQGNKEEIYKAIKDAGFDVVDVKKAP